MTNHELTGSTSRAVLFCDHTLARRVESLDAIAGKEYAVAHRALYPNVAADYVEVAGGFASFAGVNSPLTQAFALGMNGEVTPGDMNRMEAFYREREAAINVEVCPLADASLTMHLSERGYRPVEFSNVLVRRLTASPDDNDGRARVEATRREVEATEATPGEIETLTEVVSRGFAEDDEAGMAFMMEIFQVNARTAGVHHFAARIGDTIVGGGALRVGDRIAGLAGASTLPEYRGRGAQTALLDARLRFAAALDCEIATVTTLPGSTSQRNAQRHGFQVAYTRTKWMLAHV